MSADIAELGIKVTTDGAAQASKELQNLENNAKGAETATGRLKSSMDGLNSMLARLAGYFAMLKLGEFAKDAALAAARYETLGVVLRMVGENIGYTASQTNKFAKDLQDQGISMLESRQQLARMAMAGLPMDAAGQLGAAAQNAAVIAGTNSSEAFDRLVHGIVSGQSEVLRTMGILADFEGEMGRVQRETGKTAVEFTKAEKQVIRMNAVLAATRSIEGVYTAAMDTTGKALTSMTRYWENLKVVMGEAFAEGLTGIVKDLTKAMKDLIAEASRPEFRTAIAGIGSTAYESVKSLLSVGKEVGGVFVSALNAWNNMPPLIQEVGLVGALLGGTKWRLILLAAASMLGSVEKIKKVMDAVDRGELDSGFTSKFSREALDAQARAAADNTAEGLRKKIANIDRHMAEGVGRDEYDRPTERLQRMLEARKRYQQQLDELESGSSVRKSALDRLDRESEERAAKGRAEMARKDAEERERIQFEIAKKVASEKKAFQEAENALEVQRAKLTGSAVTEVIAQDAAQRKTIAAELATKMADKELPGAAKAYVKQAADLKIRALDEIKEYNLRKAQLEDASVLNEVMSQRASIVGTQDYVAQMEKIRADYSKSVLEHPLMSADFAKNRDLALEKISRDVQQGSLQSVTGIRAQIAAARAELGNLPLSGSSPQQRLSLQAIQLEIERQTKIVDLEKSRDDLLVARGIKQEALTRAQLRGDSDALKIAQLDLDTTSQRIEGTRDLIDATNQLYAARRREIEESRTAYGGLKRAVDATYDSASNLGSNLGSAFTSAVSTVEDALAKMMVKQKVSWKDLWNTIAMEGARVLVRQNVISPLMQMASVGLDALFGKTTSSGVSSAASMSALVASNGTLAASNSALLASQTAQIGAMAVLTAAVETLAVSVQSINFGGGGSVASAASSFNVWSVFDSIIPNAKGGVYSSLPDLSAYSGQIIGSPTLFRFAHGIGQFGEAGDEAILPLRRGADGRLGVDSSGSSSGNGGQEERTVTLRYMDPSGKQVAQPQTMSMTGLRKMVINIVREASELNAFGNRG